MLGGSWCGKGANCGGDGVGKGRDGNVKEEDKGERRGEEGDLFAVCGWKVSAAGLRGKATDNSRRRPQREEQWEAGAT